MFDAGAEHKPRKGCSIASSSKKLHYEKTCKCASLEQQKMAVFAAFEAASRGLNNDQRKVLAAELARAFQITSTT